MVRKGAGHPHLPTTRHLSKSLSELPGDVSARGKGKAVDSVQEKGPSHDVPEEQSSSSIKGTMRDTGRRDSVVSGYGSINHLRRPVDNDDPQVKKAESASTPS